MRGTDGQNKVMGPLPILFAGIGPCAEKTLVQFAQLARGLTLSIQGPFGLVLADAFGEEVFACDWPWIADFKVPEYPLVRERSEYVGRDDGKLLASLSSLVRRLRSVEPAVEPAAPGRIRMNSYVVVDLAAAGAVAAAGRMMQVLRQVDPAQDMTVVGLTARTAVSGSAADGEWFEAWKQLLAQLQDDSLAQRIYLLDGCDVDKTWFERPEQLHRLGAEFLLHHGLTCRGLLRQNERARTGSKESPLSVCGSFDCRTIRADLSAIAERVAERLAQDDLADLYGRSVPSGWLDSVEEQAVALIDKIAGICEKARQVKLAAAGERRDQAGGSLVAGAEMSEAIAKAVRHVSSREPVVSLCHFLKCLQPRLAKLLTKQRFRELARTRQLLAEALHRQDDSTYALMRVWLSDPQTHWVDRFTPDQEAPPEVAISRPAGLKGFLAGWVLLAVGLAAIAAGLRWHERLLVIGGGLLSIASPVLMTLPTGWALHSRSRVQEGQEIAASVRPARYRKRAPLGTLLVAATLIVGGLLCVTVPLWPESWTSIAVMGAAVAAVIAGIGVAFAVACPSESHPDQVSVEEAPGHVNPPLWRGRATGLLCLALAWAILGLWASGPVAAETTTHWVLHLTGLLLVAFGVGLALFPRTGHVHLIDHVPGMPQPLVGGLGRQSEEDDLTHRIAAMAAWIDRLALEPAQYRRRALALEAQRDRETLLDFLAADWDSQLAEAVRRELKARSDKSLKTLALQPVLWTECVAKELQDPHTRCPDLTSLFALEAVRAWMESHTLTEVLSFLKVDGVRFGRLVGRLACPHWPATRTEPDVTANVIAVGKPLWDVLAPRAGAGGSGAIMPLDWDADAHVIVALRMVQGLTQGWRGFPGLPGQLQEASPPSRSDFRSGAGEGHPDVPRPA